MNTKILEYLLAIAEEKSISRAADRFYLTQPVLSRHLKKLEQTLGAPLFERRRDGMYLTRAGIVFADNARAILYSQAQLEQKLNALLQKESKVLRIMVDVSYITYFTRNVLPLFQKYMPALQIEVSPCNAMQAEVALLDGSAELAIYTLYKPPREELEIMELFHTDYVMVFPQGYRGEPTLEAAQPMLEGDTTLMLHNIGSAFRVMEEELLARAGIFPKTILEERSFRAGLVLAREGGYCCFQPVTLMKSHPELQMPYSEPLTSYRAVMAYRPGLLLPPKLEQDVVALFQPYMEIGNSMPLLDYGVGGRI